MAVDTAAKRFSMIGFGRAGVKLTPPSGTVDRVTLIDLYNGIALVAAVTVRGSIRAVSTISAITATSNLQNITADSSIRAISATSNYTVQ